ncbi:hypothetical protein CsSME_00014763 [Camellia sinensis var. sinensis]
MHCCVARAIDCATVMLGGDEGVTASTTVRKFVTKTRQSNSCSLVLVNMRVDSMALGFERDGVRVERDCENLELKEMVLDLREIKKIDMNGDGCVDIDEFKALY